MKRQSVLVGAVVFFTALFIVHDANAQYRRYPGRYYGGPRVSVGIGGVFGFGRWGGYYGGPSVGVSVMLPPIVIGARVHSLPPGARRVYYGGEPYYYRNDTYYRERTRGGGYEVTEPPLGASLQKIPAGARRQEIDGNIYYEFRGNYYMKNEEARGDGRYIIVGKRGKLNTSEALRQRGQLIEEGEYEDDYESARHQNSRYDEVIVRNANEDDRRDTPSVRRPRTNQANTDEVYQTGPQLGDRFESLPRNSKTITVKGQTLYESPAGTRYKEVKENGSIVFEVVKTAR